MNLLDKKLLEQADFQREIAEHNFIMLKCKKCLNTELMKKRDCDLLYGYRKPCCNLMDKYTEKENKEINEKMLKKAINGLLNKFQID